MLPNPALKPLYGKVSWLYVYNTFAKTPEDNAATRIRLRFSVSSWPQLLLVDPSTMRVLGSTGRTVKSFQAAVGRTRIGPVDAGAAARVAKAEALATRLQGKHEVALARKALGHADVVVRALALESLSASEPATVIAKAATLLAVPNDNLRYAVCQAIAKHGKPVPADVAAALEALVAKPAGSRNPNVLRIRAVQALGAAGRRASIPVVAPHARTGNARNGLTRIAVQALTALAERHPAGKAEAIAALRAGFPAPGAGRMARPATSLARTVHQALVQLTGKIGVVFPPTYDAAARAALVKAFE